MSIVDREEALNAHLCTLFLVPEVAWPGRSFTPPADGAIYLQVDHLRFAPQRVTHDGSHRARGIMQITVVGEHGRSEIPTLEEAQRVADHFTVDLVVSRKHSSTRITQYPSIANGMEDLGRWRIPVSVFHEALD